MLVEGRVVGGEEVGTASVGVVAGLGVGIVGAFVGVGGLASVAAEVVASVVGAVASAEVADHLAASSC